MPTTFSALRILSAGALLAFAYSATASAYVGENFLQVPGLAGGWPGGKYKGWVKFESQYWEGRSSALPMGGNTRQGARYQSRGLNAGGRVYYSVGAGPRSGAGKLNVALDKHSPALKPLMDRCHANAPIAELTYAESAELSRPGAEWGDRPASVPEFLEYKLKDVQISCPENAEGAEQAFVLSFADIQLTNYAGTGEDIARAPAKLSPSKLQGETKTFVLTFFADASNARDEREQCPQMNTGPSEADYYALMTKEQADKEREQNAKQGGAANTRGALMMRGPAKLSVCNLPGTVRDPGHISPASEVAHGFDLDGNDGTGSLRSGQHKHKNFVSEDGRKGIDNQLFTVDGCIPGFRQNGLLPSTRNELMRQGTISVLVQVSDIESAKKDGDVDVTILYSLDPMVKSSGGSQILPNYTFSVTDDAELAPDFTRVRGHMKNGVVTTDVMKRLNMHEGSQWQLILNDARVRLVLQPDGNMKGILAGYQDWRAIYKDWANGAFEPSMKFTCPGMYNAFKRAADGMRDPVSGEFHGLSATYDFTGVPAFIPPKAQKMLAAKEP